MRRFFQLLRCLTAACLGLWLSPAHATACGKHGVALQVLGSGGPEMQDKRASSSYLVWQDGKARVLIDSGGGSALRFGEAGAQMADLDVVLFTHFHADHSADFPALVKSSYFEDRTRPLPVYGPGGNAQFPSATEFVQAMFGEKHGAFRYLSEYLDGSAGSYALQAHDLRLPPHAMQQIVALPGLAVFAAEVIHGSVPALAFRVEIGGKKIAFSGDGNGNNGNLEKLAQGVDILVAHNAVPEGAEGVPRALHMPPSVIGRIAQTAQVRKLVLSHRMLRTLGREAQTLEAIAQSFKGKTVFADDLDCYALD
ncbi:MAG TPA: MBL fold metallo-hydrolase [Methylophilaceae bacterium]|nr:MBL fold metallo-hydrolase [Methylophilaceae bacterium]